MHQKPLRTLINKQQQIASNHHTSTYEIAILNKELYEQQQQKREEVLRMSGGPRAWVDSLIYPAVWFVTLCYMLPFDLLHLFRLCTYLVIVFCLLSAFCKVWKSIFTYNLPTKLFLSAKCATYIIFKTRTESKSRFQYWKQFKINIWF